MSIERVALQERLAEVLPKDVPFSLHHLSTPPTKCPPIFSPPPGAKPQRTYCESHFLTVSIRAPSDANDLPTQSSLFVLAIEILIYTTKHLTTLFVSKADSTGYVSLLNLPKGHASPIRTIATTFIDFLVHNRQRPGRRLVVSLFARAQDQYLFPGSVENDTKHVLDDRGLVRWWCRVLDPVLRKYTSEKRKATLFSSSQDVQSATTAGGYLIVPGFDKYETTSFFPPTWRADPPEEKRWRPGHPLLDLSTHPLAPPRCLVPHFPDDPKARFLDELDEEIMDTRNGNFRESPTKRGAGQWKSVRSLEQFWEMMAFRQECSSGRLVGFIWVVFTPSETARTESDRPEISSQKFGSGESRPRPAMLPTPTASQRSEDPTPAPIKKASLPTRVRPSVIRHAKRSRSHRPRRQLTGPIHTRPPRIKISSSASLPPAESPFYMWPLSSRGTIVLSAKEYKRATDLLLRLDFAGLTTAVASSRRWADEVAVLAGRAGGSWAVEIVGKKSAAEMGEAPGKIQILSTRKRKIDGVENEVNGTSSGRGPTESNDVPINGTGENSANPLNPALVRKKPKMEQSLPDLAPSDTNIPLSSSNGCVNVLGSSLVRKKPKAA